ncbi:hypothetical protein HHI36_005439, partial [Cryptolaemus montrouzieri]
SAEMKEKEALERLEKLTTELKEFVQSKANIHKKMKTITTSVVNAIEGSEYWMSSRRLSPRVTLTERSNQAAVDNKDEVDTGVAIVIYRWRRK